MWSFWASSMKSCGLSSIRSSGRPCRGASHVTVRMKTLLTERANSGGQAVVTSDEFGHVYRDVVYVVRKDPVGELISNWQATTLAATSLLPALCGWVLCCIECLRPKRDAMHGAPSESCRASPGPTGWFLGESLVRHYEAHGRWENSCSSGRCVKRDRQAYVEELRSSVVGRRRSSVIHGQSRSPGGWRLVADQPEG